MHRVPGSGGQAAARKAGVVAHAHRLDLGHQGRKPIKVCLVDAGGRAQRQAHAVQAHGIVLTPLAQHRTGGAAGRKEVLGVDFDEIQGRLPLQQLGVMGVPPADAHGCDLVGLQEGVGGGHGWP